MAQPSSPRAVRSPGDSRRRRKRTGRSSRNLRSWSSKSWTGLRPPRGAKKFDALEKIKGERAAFEEDGSLPTVVPAKEYRRRLTKAREVLRKAYVDARSDYTKDRRGTEAERVCKELVQLEAIWAMMSLIGKPA